MSETTHHVIDYDGKWKKLIELCPRLFIQFFLPEICDQIDFSIKPKLMIQDLAKIISSPKKKGDKVADLVMEVQLNNGQKRLLYIHIEVQSAWVGNFDEKMYVPFYRLRDKYRQEVTAFALFVGETLPKNPGEYKYEFGKTFVLYRYPYYICKNQREEDLIKSKNPFAIAVLACKFLADYKKNPDTPKLVAQKTHLIEEYILQKCHEWGFGNEVIYALCDFILNIVILPDSKDTHSQNYANIMNESITLNPYTPEMVRKIVETGLLKNLRASEKKRAEEQAAARLKLEKVKKEMKAIQVAEKKKTEEAAKKKVLAAKEKEQLAKESAKAAIATEKQAKADKARLEKKLKQSIVLLSQEAGFDDAKIAKMLNLELTYVTETLQVSKKSTKK